VIIEGLADLPLDDVRVDSTHVHFRFPPQLDSLAFDGDVEGDAISGQVLGQGRPTPTRLTPIEPLPAPASRVEAWQQDIDYAATRMPEYDRSFTPRTREQFRQALAHLRLTLARMDDAQILVALSRAVALSGNAHTRLRLDPTRQGAFSTELPIRIWWFSDGPYVIKAAEPYRRALRCRVVAIGGHDVLEARGRVETVFAGNPSWASYLAPIYLTSPDILHGLGLIASVKGASVTLEDARGRRFDLQVPAERIDPSARADESWQELSPLMAMGKRPWTHALAAGAERVPLYLRHPDKPYWFEFRPESGHIYFQFNRSDNADEGQTFQAFGDSLLAFVAQHAVRDVVVDLRLNSGGNLGVARAFMRDLAREDRINPRDRLFVITGPCTFSAGLYHAAQLKQDAQATFVGGPVGDRLDYWAEGGEIVLPNSRAVLCYANGFHGYSGMDHPECRPYYEELSIPSLEPDIPAPMSSADYFSARDPVLEAVEARLRN